MLFFESSDLLLCELEIHSKILRKTYQKFMVHLFVYLMIFKAYFIIYEDLVRKFVNKKINILILRILTRYSYIVFFKFLLKSMFFLNWLI